MECWIEREQEKLTGTMNHGHCIQLNGINLKIIDAMEMNKKCSVVTIINYTNFV